jgi:hypothetical protein
MGRHRKIIEETPKATNDLVASMIPKVEQEIRIEDMPLTSLGDYLRYNKEARRMNKKLRILRYPIKQCPAELHPMERIVFGRNDQPNNPLPVYLSNEMIEFSIKLYPGRTYDLPRCVVEYLATKGTPIWAWFDNPDGSRETRKTATNPRFAIRTIYKD